VEERNKEKTAEADTETQAKSAVRAASPEVGRNTGRQLLRGLPGSLQKSMR